MGLIPSLFHTRLAFFRSQLQSGVGLFGKGELGHEEVGQIVGDGQVVFAFAGNLEEPGGFMQAAGVGDLVFPGFAGSHRFQRAHQHAAMIGVGGGTGGNLTQQVARGNGIGIGAADAEMGFGGDAARPHVTEAAANAVGAEFALRFLQLITVKDRARLGVIGNLDHIDRCLIQGDRLPNFWTRGRHQFFSCWS